MDRLSGLLPFVRSAELGGFAAAGRDLDLSPSAVGKAVARLEQDLHVRLFQRSTRRMQLTEEGRLFYERCKRILEDLDDAHAMLSQTLREPRGRLRVSAPLVSYHFLLPVLPAFAARYPHIELDMDFNDRIVDLIGERVDVAIRSGDLPDSRLAARTLGSFRLRLYAAPDYLARHGTSQRARDLERHRAVRFRYPNAGTLQEWPLALAAQVNGAGRFQALWPSNRNLSPKVRVFVDFLAERLFRDSPP